MTLTVDEEREQKRIHTATAKYLYEKWWENRKLYEEQQRTGKDLGIHYCLTKKLHPKFKDFTPLNVERYVRDWQREKSSCGGKEVPHEDVDDNVLDGGGDDEKPPASNGCDPQEQQKQSQEQQKQPQEQQKQPQEQQKQPQEQQKQPQEQQKQPQKQQQPTKEDSSATNGSKNGRKLSQDGGGRQNSTEGSSGKVEESKAAPKKSDKKKGKGKGENKWLWCVLLNCVFCS